MINKKNDQDQTKVEEKNYSNLIRIELHSEKNVNI